MHNIAYYNIHIMYYTIFPVLYYHIMYSSTFSSPPCLNRNLAFPGTTAFPPVLSVESCISPFVLIPLDKEVEGDILRAPHCHFETIHSLSFLPPKHPSFESHVIRLDHSILSVTIIYGPPGQFSSPSFSL